MGWWKRLFGGKPPESAAGAAGNSPGTSGADRPVDPATHDSAVNPGESAVARHAIDISKDGIRVDGMLLSSMTVAAFADVFGAPRIVEPASKQPDDRGHTPQTLAIWDEVGLYVFTPDAVDVAEIALRLAQDPGWESEVKFDFAQMRPRGIFPGQLTINGKAPMDAVSAKEKSRAYSYLEVKAGPWDITLDLCSALREPLTAMPFPERLEKIETGAIAELVQSSSMPLREVSISYKPAKVSTGKWKLAKPTEAVVSISHLPFRLAIVQELMYVQERLTPKFDVHDFAQDYAKREIDPDDYGSEMIPEVRTWFRDLPVPMSMALHVERLCFDGGNDIYLQLIPQWDGEDDQFTVTALTDTDLAQFPNLRRIEGAAGWLSDGVRKRLVSRGVEIVD